MKILTHLPRDYLLNKLDKIYENETKNKLETEIFQNSLKIPHLQWWIIQ